MVFSTEEKEQIWALLNKEVVLALGCTEPVAVALAVAKSREVLGKLPEKTTLLLSKNILKNAMGVGIPGTGMIGLPIAIAIGLLFGESEKGLEVLAVSKEQVAQSKEWLEKNKESISIQLKDTPEKLYIEVITQAGIDRATSVISHSHTHFSYIEKNTEVWLSPSEEESKTDESAPVHLSMRTVYDFAMQIPFQEAEFILETARVNAKVSEEGLNGYGLHVGKIMMNQAEGNLIQSIVAKTAAASDARMDGCSKPVYSNSGSGNQGITCTLPVYEYGKALEASDESLIKALLLSHLTSIYVKQGIGRLSALCGVVNASIGACCGIVYLKGGSYEQICFAVKNMINTLTGLLCDGAKPSCALKVSSGIYTAFVCAELAINNKVVDETDGISEKDIDRSIANLARIGSTGMNFTDEVVLDILVNKKK